MLLVVGTVTPVPVPHPEGRGLQLGRVPGLISEDLLAEKTPTKQQLQQQDNVKDHISYKDEI